MTDTTHATKATRRKRERPPTTLSGANLFFLIGVLIGLAGILVFDDIIRRKLTNELVERNSSLESAHRRIAELESELQVLDSRLAAAQASPSFSESATHVVVRALQSPVFVLLVLVVVAVPVVVAALVGLTYIAALAVGIVAMGAFRLIVFLATTLFAWTRRVLFVFERAFEEVF